MSVDSADLAKVTLHPALIQALAIFPEATASRAAAALSTALADRITLDSEEAWSNSFLTGDGFPVELTFTTADTCLRWTVEPMRAALPPRRRFEEAARLLDRLDPAGLPHSTLAALQRMQQEGELSYGAWLGGRHGTEGSEYKLYAEAPEDLPSEAVLSRLVPGLPQPRLPDRAARVRMLAYSPALAQWEVYYRIDSLQPYHLPRLFAPAGLEGSADEVLGWIAEAYGHPLRSRLPGPSVGVSYTLQLSGRVRQVTLFFFARVFWGADIRIRQRFGQWARAVGWDDIRYQQVTASLAVRQSWQTYHGILGITIAPERRLALSLGVRPVEMVG